MRPEKEIHRALEKDCPDCRGRGWQFTPAFGAPPNVTQVNCFSCNGTGQMESKCILNLTRKGLIGEDMGLYILESLSRAAAGKIGNRSYRGDDGKLRVKFDGEEVVYEPERH